MSSQLFPAQLKYWRGRRGLSQLDASLMAGISARHLSFLETGRARPSEDMALRLLTILDVPLRHRNRMMLDAGFKASFPEPAFTAMDPAIRFAIERMLEQQEPYPMTVLNACYDVIDSNQAMKHLLSCFIAERASLTTPLNLFSLLFDPRLARTFVKNWEQVAGAMLLRLHREMLERTEDAGLKQLYEKVLLYPDVPQDWRRPDFSMPSAPTMAVVLEKGDLTLQFFTTTTIFNAPQQVTLDEIRLESYFPLDEQTRVACKKMAA
ncbi:helix-turn-helix transcriptional regulator [soil metagenome]